MKVGIVVEYNPFHNGHLYQIKKIREELNPDFLAIVMSGDYVQRGEFSLLDKWSKTRIALELGIDLVIELPVYYSIQNAEIFSKMATKILDYLNIDVQVFGAETDDISIFYDVIELQKIKEYNQEVIENIKKGNSYTAAQTMVLKERGFDGFVKSNNILGLEYIRAMQDMSLNIKPFIVKREAVDYNEDIKINSFSSATYIRKMYSEKKLDNIKDAIPQETYNYLSINERKLDEADEKIFEIFKYKFLTTSKEMFLNTYDTNVEIYRRINKILKSELYSWSYSDFLSKIKSRNLSSKRIKRIIYNFVLSITKEVIDKNISYVRVLGFNAKGQQYLKEITKMEKKIYVNWRDIEKSSPQENSKIKIEKNAFLLKNLLFSEKEIMNPIIIT